MAWNNAVITNKGLEMLRQSIDDGELTVVSASGSDEIYPAASLMAQTAPANEKQSFDITEIKDMDNGKRIRVTITNEGLTTGYVMKQLCVWARFNESEAPQIIAILQDEDGTPIPAEGEIASYLMQFYVLLKVDRTANIKINVENPSFVTYDAIEGMLEDKADLVDGKVSTEQLPDMNYVPTSRTVNGKPLNSNISLTAADVNAKPSSWTPTVDSYLSNYSTNPVQNKVIKAAINAIPVGAQIEIVTWTGAGGSQSSDPAKTVYCSKTNPKAIFICGDGFYRSSGYAIKGTVYATRFDNNTNMERRRVHFNSNSIKFDACDDYCAPILNYNGDEYVALIVY